MNRIRKILAWAGIILLAALYLTTFFLGIFGSPRTTDLLKACVVLTVVVPVLLYAMMMLAKILRRDAQGPSGEAPREVHTDNPQAPKHPDDH